MGGGAGEAGARLPWWQPFVELAKLVLATAIGVVVTAVHRQYRVERPQTQAMEQAQVLLCVSGALMMIIIDGSVARAFGIAGAASIIRFRTPVEDPKDITILFLLMGLGMSAGVGVFGVAGLGTAFLCVCLALLNRIGARHPRAMMVEVEADGREFPTAHVQGVFARHRVIFEPREVSQGKAMSVRYYTLLDPDHSLDSLSEELMDGGRPASSRSRGNCRARASDSRAGPVAVEGHAPCGPRARSPASFLSAALLVVPPAAGQNRAAQAPASAPPPAPGWSLRLEPIFPTAVGASPPAVAAKKDGVVWDNRPGIRYGDWFTLDLPRPAGSRTDVDRPRPGWRRRDLRLEPSPDRNPGHRHQVRRGPDGLRRRVHEQGEYGLA